MTKKKKVLSLVLSYKLGGTAINSLRFIKNTQAYYDHYTVAHRVDTVKDLALRDEFGRYTIECFDVDTTRFKFRSLVSLLLIAYRISPDIVHVNAKGGALYGFFLRVFYWRRFRLFYTMRGFHVKYTGVFNSLHLFFEHIFNRIVDRAIAVSFSERDFYLRSIRGCERKTVVIPNGIEVSRDTNLDDQIRIAKNRHEINIVTLSRTDPQKDLFTMLKAFDMVDNSVGLHVIGGYVTDNEDHAEYNRQLQELLSTLDCRERVYLWGDLNRAGDLISYFDIYWSTAIFEGLPTAVVEAMMSRVLVVATNCRGNVDLIIHKETGFLTQMGSVIDCKEKIIEAIGILNTSECSFIVENAYRFSQKFTIKHNVEALRDLYDGSSN